MQWAWANIQPWFPDPRYPILIPETGPTSHGSFERATNLRLPEEFSPGDWHFKTSCFGYPEPTYIPFTGRAALVNTVQIVAIAKPVPDTAYGHPTVRSADLNIDLRPHCGSLEAARSVASSAATADHPDGEAP